MQETLYHYKAKVYECTDGDTFKADVDLGFHLKYRVIVRILEINAPEKRGLKKVKGLAAKKFLEDLILHKEVYIKSTKIDSFGRILAKVWIDNKDVSKLMIESGHASPYQK